MKNHKLPALLLMAALLAVGTFVQAAERITFARNAASAIVVGKLRGFHSEKVYVLRVRAGQQLSTSQLGEGSHPVTVTLTDPHGNDASDMDASCNNRKLVSPTLPGDYTIKVVECMKAAPWRGTFRLKIKVI